MKARDFAFMLLGVLAWVSLQGLQRLHNKAVFRVGDAIAVHFDLLEAEGRARAYEAGRQDGALQALADLGGPLPGSEGGLPKADVALPATPPQDCPETVGMPCPEGRAGCAVLHAAPAEA